MIYNQWYAILPSKFVKKNKVLSVKRLGLELAFFRNSKGKLGCVTDKCSHRGASIAMGKVKGDCIQCPFHGLRFDTTGKCTLIPANGKAQLDSLDRFNVESYIVREKYGIIFFWYGDLDKAKPKIPFFPDIKEGMVYSELEDHWNAHYSRCIENQLDVVHLPFVHHNTIGRGNKTLVNGPKVIFEDNILITSADNEEDHGQEPKSFDEAKIKDTNLNFIFPNIWLNRIHKKMFIFIYFAPVDKENTVLFIRFYTALSDSKVVNNMIASAGCVGNKIVERQDKRIVVTQRPKISKLRGGENLVRGDRPIIEYRKIREDLMKKVNKK